MLTPGELAALSAIVHDLRALRLAVDELLGEIRDRLDGDADGPRLHLVDDDGRVR